MIAVDSSALLAVVLKEVGWEACMGALVAAEALVISAGTLAEALIVASRRGVAPDLRILVDSLPLRIEPVTESTAKRMALAYDRFGKGLHPARLNFADCFAYVVAEDFDCPLLYVGNDFAQTDISSAWTLAQP